MLRPAARADRRWPSRRVLRWRSRPASRRSSTSWSSCRASTPPDNGRLAVIAVLCVALLAGWGLDELTGREPSAAARRRRLVLAAGGLLAVLPGRDASPRRSSTPRRARRRAARSPGASPTRAGCAGRRRRSSRSRPSLLEWLARRRRLALVARWLCGCAGGSASRAFVGARARAGGARPVQGRHGLQPGDPAQPRGAAGHRRRSATSRPARRRASRGCSRRGAVALAVPLPPNVAMRYGLYDARGYDYPVEERYAELWRDAIAPAPGCNYAFCPESRRPTPRRCRALGLLGVTDLLQNRGDPPLRGLPAGLRGPRRPRLRNPAALPRAFLVDRQRVVDGARRRARRRDRRRLPGAVGRGDRAARRRHARQAAAGRAAAAGRGADRATTGTSAWSSTRDARGRSLLVLDRQLVPGLEGDRRRPRRADRARRLPDPRRGGAGGRPPRRVPLRAGELARPG